MATSSDSPVATLIIRAARSAAARQPRYSLRGDGTFAGLRRTDELVVRDLGGSARIRSSHHGRRMATILTLRTATEDSRPGAGSPCRTQPAWTTTRLTPTRPLGAIGLEPEQGRGRCAAGAIHFERTSACRLTLGRGNALEHRMPDKAARRPEVHATPRSATSSSSGSSRVTHLRVPAHQRSGSARTCCGSRSALLTTTGRKSRRADEPPRR